MPPTSNEFKESFLCDRIPRNKSIAAYKGFSTDRPELQICLPSFGGFLDEFLVGMSGVVCFSLFPAWTKAFLAGFVLLCGRRSFFHFLLDSC